MARRTDTILSPEKRRAEQKRRAVEDIDERHGAVYDMVPRIVDALETAEDPEVAVAVEAPVATENAEARGAAEDPGGEGPAPAASHTDPPAGTGQSESFAARVGRAFPPAASWLPILAMLVVASLGAGFFAIAPGMAERSRNKVVPHEPYEISAKAAALHERLVVGDLHADSLLWARDLTARGARGHLDLPRLAEGNVALQVFGVVSSVPNGLNYQENESGSDSITLLSIAQLWPIGTWGSLLQRALYQGEKLQEVARRSAGRLRVIRTRTETEAVLTARAEGQPVIGGILSLEGAQVLDGEIANIQRLYDAGYRIMGLQHFTDNALGGSLHGVGKEGLTPFGRQAVREMARLGIIIDLAHASEAVVRDVLGMRVRRLVISHTGVRGACKTPRNISNSLIKQVAAQGGLIGIGFWDAAACDITPVGIVKSIRHAVRLVGVDHVALGSDFDGATTTAFDASELAVLTDEMLKAGFSEIEIRLVMGGNLASYLLQNLPG